MKTKYSASLVRELVICSLGLLLVAAFCSAQPTGPPWDVTLEARIAQSQAVVRGTVSDCTSVFVAKPGGFYGGRDKNGKKLPYGFEKCTLTVQVNEMLKGKTARTIQVVQETSPDDKRFEQWAEHHTSFLFFIGDKSWSNLAGSDPACSTIRLGEAVPYDHIYTGDRPVYLMDSTTLTDPQKILVQTRALAKRGFPSTNVCWVPSTNSFGYLQIPVTPALEKWARRMIESGDRVEGVKALRFFKSSKNIKRLKPLLNDTNFSVQQIQYRVWDDKQIYRVRQTAYEVLQGWGVKVPKPVTEVNVPWQFDFSTRQKLEVLLPQEVWVKWTADSFDVGTGVAGYQTTNVLAGSNTIVGVRFAWFVHPEGEPRALLPDKIDQEYQPTASAGVPHFEKIARHLPPPGQKYTVEMEFTLFETDNPPQDVDNTPMDSWRPEDGKNYRVLAQRTLKQTGE